MTSSHWPERNFCHSFLPNSRITSDSTTGLQRWEWCWSWIDPFTSRLLIPQPTTTMASVRAPNIPTFYLAPEPPDTLPNACKHGTVFKFILSYLNIPNSEWLLWTSAKQWTNEHYWLHWSHAGALDEVGAIPSPTAELCSTSFSRKKGRPHLKDLESQVWATRAGASKTHDARSVDLSTEN